MITTTRCSITTVKNAKVYAKYRSKQLLEFFDELERNSVIANFAITAADADKEYKRNSRRVKANLIEFDGLGIQLSRNS